MRRHTHCPATQPPVNCQVIQVNIVVLKICEGNDVRYNQDVARTQKGSVSVWQSASGHLVTEPEPQWQAPRSGMSMEGRASVTDASLGSLPLRLELWGSSHFQWLERLRVRMNEYHVCYALASSWFEYYKQHWNLCGISPCIWVPDIWYSVN